MDHWVARIVRRIRSVFSFVSVNGRFHLLQFRPRDGDHLFDLYRLYDDEEQSGENSDDRNDHKQFNQRERPSDWAFPILSRAF